MPVYRIQKTKNFTVMSNYHLKDKGLSLKAKGLLSIFLALPDDWDFSKNGIVSICKEGEDAVTTAMKELKERGYLNVEKVLPDETKTGRIEYIYNIYEKPYTKKQGTEIQHLENPTQLNTNKLNTKNNNICPSNDEQDNQPVTEKEDENHFEEVWEIYPRKEGKNKAYTHYKSWLKGKKFAGKTVKLTERQMWFAVRTYKNECEKKMTEKQYIKMGSTFFNESIYEYVQKNELEGVYNEKNF